MSGFFTGGVSRLTLTSRHPCYLGEISIPETKFIIPTYAKSNATWNNGVTIDISEYPLGTVEFENKAKSLGVSKNPDGFDFDVIDHCSGSIYVGDIGGELIFLPKTGFIMPYLSYDSGYIKWAYRNYIYEDNGNVAFLVKSPLYKGFKLNAITIKYGAR